ncbi:MAG: DUF485 domain-containing protein [Desulfitobacteriaceae bacterium]
MRWDKIAESADFRQLIKIKSKFMTIAIIFSSAYYFALPLSVGYLKPFMDQKITGSINLAYWFALSQFFVAWLIAGIYAWVANRKFDPLAEKIRSEHAGGLER